ncbi:MAG: hypothetical protein HFG70_00810 [Hungatella sp.]|jgi:hypothetical protein|nr:hypothetical protein [Hungatella sp.]
MSDNIIQLNEDLIKHDLKDLVRSSVEESRRYMNMEHLSKPEKELLSDIIAG